MDKRPFLDFKDIKARARFLDVLDRYHVQVKKVSQAQYTCDCPLPSHVNKKEHGTFAVNIEKGVFKCFSDSCRHAGNGSQGNVIDFVSEMEKTSVYEAAAKLAEWFRDTSPKEEPLAAYPEGNKTLGFVLKDIDPEHEMIQARGIRVPTAKEWGVGFFPGNGSMMNRIVFPLYEKGNLVGYAGRTTLPVTPDNPKWLFGKGLRKTFLYGLERCDPAKPLVLTESLWSVLWLAQKSIQAAALMGSEMTDEEERCLEPFGTITVALDNDEAGHEKAAPIVERLRKRHYVLKAYMKE